MNTNSTHPKQTPRPWTGALHWGATLFVASLLFLVACDSLTANEEVGATKATLTTADSLSSVASILTEGTDATSFASLPLVDSYNFDDNTLGPFTGPIHFNVAPGNVEVRDGKVYFSSEPVSNAGVAIRTDVSVTGDFSVAADFTQMALGADRNAWRYAIRVIDDAGHLLTFSDSGREPSPWRVTVETNQSLLASILWMQYNGTGGQENVPTTMKISRTGSQYTFSIVRDGVETVIGGGSYSVPYFTSTVTAVRLDAWSWNDNYTGLNTSVDNYKLWAENGNQPPTADAGGPYAGDEGAAVPFDGSGSSDPDSDPLTYEWDVDYDGATFDVDATGEKPSHAYAENGTYTVALRVSDANETSEVATTTATIANVAPSVGAITGAPFDPIPLGTEVSVSASFTDPGTADTHVGEVDWNANGTATTTSAAINESNGSGSASGSYTYMEAGVYVVKMTVTDDDGDAGSALYQYVVVYDPAAGFVTGGGWIDSPAGAFAADPTLTGKASFGFVSKYKKGANVPSGNTQFEFKAAQLNFHSTSYDWLVVAGAKGKFKGSGTINGAGDYGFMLTATDSNVSGGGSVDTFRIKIWDKMTDEVVYDNQMGAPEDSDAGTALGGGNIAIHSQGV